ncbi:hypothetical protein ACHQM5_019145 [Ranunculus cassubicifolius]
MFDWNEDEIVWGESAEVDDHIVPCPKGNEEKRLLTSGASRKKQFTQELGSVTVAVADKEESGANGLFSGFKLDSSSQSETNETPSAPGAGINSWPGSPLTNDVSDGEYAGRNAQNSFEMQVSEYGTELDKYNSAKVDAAQSVDGPGLFGNDCEDKENGSYLEYSWDNIGSFDDLDSMFRSDDPIFGRESLGNGELWSSPTGLFTSMTKSFSAPSPSSGVSAMCSSENEMKVKILQNEDPSCTPELEQTNHANSYDMKDRDTQKENAGGKEQFHFADPVADCVGEKSKMMLEQKMNKEMMKTKEVWNTQSTSKTNGKRKLVQCAIKAENREQSSQDLSGPWSLTANQYQSFGNQLENSSVESVPFSINSQKQHVVPEPWLYWQTSHLNSAASDGNSCHHYPMNPLPQQPQHMEYGSSLASLKHGNKSKALPALSKPLIMTTQEKLEKLKRRQQMQALLAIQEQQQQFCLYEKSSQDHRHQDTDGSTIVVQENLFPPSLDSNFPIEHNDSNTVPLATDDYSLEGRALDQFQDVIGKLDIKIRLCMRDSLYRLAQSAMQRNNTLDISSTNNNIQCDGVSERLLRLPEVETETNLIDRTVAHLLFHQPQEKSTAPVKDAEIRINSPVGCLSDCSRADKILIQPDADQSQSNPSLKNSQNTSNVEQGETMENEETICHV